MAYSYRLGPVRSSHPQPQLLTTDGIKSDQQYKRIDLRYQAYQQHDTTFHIWSSLFDPCDFSALPAQQPSGTRCMPMSCRARYKARPLYPESVNGGASEPRDMASKHDMKSSLPTSPPNMVPDDGRALFLIRARLPPYTAVRTGWCEWRSFVAVRVFYASSIRRTMFITIFPTVVVDV
jgi:hypothetical protein